jgi:alkylation response protein AidB-like acyl-CoA dehydrogenase
MSADVDEETVEAFTVRARAWLAEHMPAAAPSHSGVRWHRSDDDEIVRIRRCKELQRMLFDGQLAGVCVPSAYGGRGLTTAHQEALITELAPYDYPADIQSPTFTPCMAVLLDCGTEEQKERYVPAILRGDELWVQLLSEPSGGSDVAGAQTTAIRDGDEWVLNGSKIWTTGAWWADWGLCLARTNWDVPKHRGLTVFIVPLDRSGIEIQRIEMLNGSRAFCQVFLTDVRVPDANRVGDIDLGWTVGQRWMHHERTVVGGSPYITRPAGAHNARESGEEAARLIRRLAAAGHVHDRHVLELVGEAEALELVGDALTRHIAAGIRDGRLNDQSAAISRLYAGIASVRQSTIEFELAGQRAVAWAEGDEDLGQVGVGYLMRQAACIGGGTTEMSRNVISERVLGMPRELSGDRDIPFRDVRRSSLDR